MKSKDLFDGLMQDYEEEYRQRDNRVDPEDLDSQKVAAPEESLAVTKSSGGHNQDMKMPTVKPPSDTRRGRKMAEAEQETQWSMIRTAQRTVLAANSVVAVAIHAQRQLDLAQEIMADRFYGVRRQPAMNEFMCEGTSNCLSLAESGVMAILESHPKRIAEDL